MRTCNHCGASIDDDAQFCTTCGKQVEQQEQTTTGQTDVKKVRTNSIRPWHYALGISVIVIALAAIFVPKVLKMYNKVTEPLLPATPVTWERFVTSKRGEIALYSKPDVRDVWGKAGVKDIMPVTDETTTFYKVYVGNGDEMWVKKNLCKEVDWAPLENDMLTDYLLEGQRLNSRTRLYNEGNFQGLTLFFYRDFMHECHLEVLILDSLGRMIRPVCHSLKAKPVSGRGLKVLSETDEVVVEYGTNYQIADENFKGFLDLMKLSDKEVFEIWQAAQAGEPQKVQVYYYFPSLKSMRYYDVNLDIYGESNTKVKTGTVEESRVVTGYSVLDKGDFLYSLMAEINGDLVETKLDYPEMAGINVEKTADFDGDGNQDCLLSWYTGGNCEDCSGTDLIFYNQEDRTFHRIENITTTDTEEWKGKISLVEQGSTTFKRFVLEDGQLKTVEDKTANVGKIIWKCERKDLFPVEDEDSEDKYAFFDIDGDGEDDTIVFGHDSSHANMYGINMYINKIYWSRLVTSEEYIGLWSGESFSILENTTNGIHDMLIDGGLFRWNGSQYEMWHFDGKKLTK